MATNDDDDNPQGEITEGPTFKCKYTEDEVEKLGFFELDEILKENGANYENLVNEGEMRELVLTLMKMKEKEAVAACSEQSEMVFSSAASQQGAKLMAKILENDMKMKQGLNGLYDDIDRFMKDKSVDSKLKEEMITEFGSKVKDNSREYQFVIVRIPEEKVQKEDEKIIEIAKYKDELMEEECPIVVAGETTAGKSSLLNLLLGSDFLPHSLLTCTTTICRLRNSENKEVHVIDQNDKTMKLDLPPDMDAGLMKQKLKQYVSLEQDINKYKYVDIYWPIPILKSNAIIVDTPGIGSSKELTKRLYEYLPKAVAFIYVINSSNAGGVQSDRLEKIFEVQKDSGKMYEFDPGRAIFVCNKWDQVPPAEEQIVWDNTVKKLKEHWPNFKESQMFKLSTKEETRRASTPGLEYTSSFQKLLTGIGEMIPASLQAKVSRHSNWQRIFLEQMLKRIVGRIKLSRKTEHEKKNVKVKIEERIKKLRHNIPEVKNKVQKKAEEYCKDISRKLHEHLNSSETMGRIFLWSLSELPSGSDFEVIEYQSIKLIIERINTETREWCRKTNVNNITQELSDLFKAECKLIDAQCDEINRTLLDIGMPLDSGLHNYDGNILTPHDPLFTKHEKIVLAVTSPLWLPLVIGAGIIALPFGAAVGVKGLVDQSRKMNEYNSNKLRYMMDWRDSVLRDYNQKKIYELMEDTYLKDFNTNVSYICENVIPQQIAADEQFIDHIKNDIRTSCEIRQQYHPLESKCKCMLGKLLLIQMEFFAGFKLSKKNIKETEVKEELGKGQFSDVHVASVLINDKWMKAAVKTLRKPLENTQSYVQLTEVQNLRKLHHPNIVDLYGVSYRLGSQGKKFLQIYMEYCDDSLADIVFGIQSPLPCYKFKDISQCRDSWEFYLRITTGVCRGLTHIHSMGFVHRDLKLANILIKNGEAKIADVGLAKEEEDILGTVTGTPTTMAPEVLSGLLYGSEADIYSVGIILWEMWYARPGFTHPARDDSEQPQFIAKNFTQLSEYVKKGLRPDFETRYKPPNQLVLLMKKCWDHDTAARPTAEQVLERLQEIQKMKNASTSSSW